MMVKSSQGIVVLSMALGLLPLLGGCDGTGGGGGQAGSSPQGPPGPGGAGPGQASGIKLIMTKLAKGPNSLTPVLGKALKEAEPAWETIQEQSKEYALLAAEMGKLDPPKGSKESWAKLTADYAESAADLEKAASAKDKDAALTAHGQLANSCMACHREHRRMGPGGGGFPGGGPPGGGGPPPPPDRAQ